MNCPEHLVCKAWDERVYLWLYWRDVPRETIPLRVWMNPLRYELFIRLRRRTITINREGLAAGRIVHKVGLLRCRLFGHTRHPKFTASPCCRRCFAPMEAPPSTA